MDAKYKNHVKFNDADNNSKRSNSCEMKRHRSQSYPNCDNTPSVDKNRHSSVIPTNTLPLSPVAYCINSMQRISVCPPHDAPMDPNCVELEQSEVVSFTFKSISILYGTFMSVLSLVLLILEASATKNRKSFIVSNHTYEIFLYSVSIIWLIYSFIDINLYKRKRRNQFHHSRDYSYESNHIGTGLYLKIGCGLFCLGSLIYSGLEIAKAFEYKRFCIPIDKFINNLMLLIFSFTQYFFLLKHANIIITKRVIVSSFGMCHVLVTNLSVWFKFILTEAIVHAYDPLYTNSGANATSSYKNSTSRCMKIIFQISDIASKFKIFLYPCTIEHSIICVNIFALIWYNVGRKPSNSCLIERRYSLAASQIYYLDCNKSIKGLFAGIFIFLIQLIIIIFYFVTGTSSDLNDLYSGARVVDENITLLKIVSFLSTEIIELIQLLLIIILILILFKDLVKLPMVTHSHETELSFEFDELLQLGALCGSYLFNLFRVLAFILNNSKFLLVYKYFLLVNSLLAIIKSTLQTILILNAFKRRCISQYDLQRKPGREVITLLIILNVSLWLLYTLTRHKYENFYFKDLNICDQCSQVFISADNTKYSMDWILMNTVSFPLLLYYHFHSSVCLSNAWKVIYCRI